MSSSSNPDFIAINIKEAASPNTTYYCNWCNRKLFYREHDPETGKHIWLCTFCNIEHIPDNQLTKRKSVLKTPGPNVDFYGNVIGANNIIPIAMIDDVNKNVSSTTYKQQKLPAAYEALKKSGFKFINYEER